MKAFISVSGQLSTQVGKQLKDWLAAVLQHVEPWIAVDDINKGAQWPTQLAESLTESDCGILVLSADNLTSPWLMYEAGVIAARTNMERVVGLLIDVAPSVVAPPLGLYQLTQFERADILKLIHRMNNWTNNPRASETVERAFDALWPDFETRVQSCKATCGVTSEMPSRDPHSLLVEILELTRDVYRRTCSSVAENRIRLLQNEIRGSTPAAGILDGLLANPSTAVESVSIQMRQAGPAEFRPSGATGTRQSSVTTLQLNPPPAGVMPARDTLGT
jgi:hypothetical protein